MLSVTEILRKRVSWLVGGAFAVAIVFTQPADQPGLFLQLLEMLGYLCLMMASLGRIWASVYISGYKNQELCTDGPYSLVRNPLYVFSFLGFVGIILSMALPILLIPAIPAFIGYYHFVIRSEEVRLRSIFGAAFDEYCTKVNRLWPSFGGFWSREVIPMNPRLVTRAMVDASWFLWINVVLEMVKYLHTLPAVNAALPYWWRAPF